MQERPSSLPTGADPLERPARVGGRSRGHLGVLVVAAGLLIALALLRWVAEPDPRGHGTHEQLGLPPCAMMVVTGLPCPGCGVTTSMALALRGEWRAALVNQPFGVLTTLAIPLFAAWVALGHATGRDRYADLRRFHGRRAWILLGTLLLGCWAYKLALAFTES